MPNLYVEFLKLNPPAPRYVGSVVDVDQGVATVELPSGAHVRARGDCAVGDWVYVRDGAIEGPAPQLPVVSVPL